MKKNILFTLLIAGLISCKSNKITTSNDVNSNVTIIQKFSNTINVKDAKKHLYTLASDEYEGRRTSEKGQKMAAEYLSKQYERFGIKGIEGTQNYFQIVPIEALINKRRKFEPTNASENVLAFIEGSEKPEEIIVISSHYDHEGIKRVKSILEQMTMLLELLVYLKSHRHFPKQKKQVMDRNALFYL